MGQDKILRDGGAVITDRHGLQVSLLAEISSKSVFIIVFGQIQKNISTMSKSPTHPLSIHISLFLSLVLSHA
jgi:hypothetical protein